MSSRSSAETLLESLIDRFGPDFAQQHRWFDERDRWVELVQSLVARCSKQSEHEIRAACEELTQQGLLDHPSIVKNPDAGSKVIASFMSHGLSESEVEKALSVLSEVSTTLDEAYGGKLQRYLRHSFERMADKMVDELPVTSIGVEDTRHAFRFWLQNVANAPLSLTHPDAAKYCEAKGVTWTQMVDAAEAADINLALLDDMVHAAINSELYEKRAI
jgi:hypothetical protein